MNKTQMNKQAFFAKAVVCLLLISLPNMLCAQWPGIPKGWSDGYVFANGIRIHYYHAVPNPGKPVIVMAHGVSDNGLCWTTLTQKLQSDYDIYMVDARGHGLTDPPTPADSSNAMVKDLVGFIEKMKLVKPILMGHSMGAGTVMRVGADYPQLAKAIIMLDPGLRARTALPAATPASAPQPNPATQAPASGSKELTVNIGGSPEVLVAQNNYSYADLYAIGRRQNPLWGDLDVQYWALSKRQYHGNYGGRAQVRRGPANTDNPLEKIVAPAIILKADASPEVRKANEKAASAMPNGKIVHIDSAAHNLHHDKLERATQVIKEFLSTL
jgi:pimeloyl-ACP methyl ester carboxylesterase